MSAWVKFLTDVPPASGNYGFKIQGKVNNDWVSGMTKNEWKWVSAVSPVTVGGDGNHNIYIFDSVGQYTEVVLSDMELEVFTGEEPEPRAYN